MKAWPGSALGTWAGVPLLMSEATSVWNTGTGVRVEALGTGPSVCMYGEVGVSGHFHCCVAWL
jgi:hypothetical protein